MVIGLINVAIGMYFLISYIHSPDPEYALIQLCVGVTSLWVGTMSFLASIIRENR